MFDKTTKRRLKLFTKWLCLAAFIAVFLFLHFGFGKTARDSFSIFAGGLGMFIYGMNLMSSSLQRIAGSRLKAIISALTRNPFTGLLTGLGVTALIQSSSATTVMTVGFVNAGLMTLHQAIGIILGANIGTTVTAQLIAFNLTDLAWPILAVGSAMIIFCKSRTNRSWGETLLGFSLLFLGMKFMGDTLKIYKDHELFKTAFVSFSHYRILGVLAGLMVTLVIQSSSATVGLTMSLMGTGAFGTDPYLALMAAVPIVLGDNIGTCITAVFASIGASRNAQRTALVHTLFNVFGTLLFLPILDIYCKIIMQTAADPMRQVANAHTIFNVFNALLFLPMTGLLKYLVMLCLPRHADEAEVINNLDKRFLATPPIAIAQAEAHLGQAIDIIRRKFTKINDLLHEPENDIEDISNVSNSIDALKKQRDQITRDLNKFLIALAQKDLSENLSRQVTRILYLSKDLEIISSQLEKLMNLLVDQTENNRALSSEAREEMHLCMNRTLEIFTTLTATLRLSSKDAEEIRQQIYGQSMLDLAARNNLIDRIKNGQHDPLESILLLDTLRSIGSLLSSLQHVCDHLLYKF
jgi:phosphate:Na+ symporter